MSIPEHTKAITYITSRGRLLVFRHTNFPEAGIQVPAGSVEAGEDPANTAMREAEEETGLTGLSMSSCLGTDLVRVSINGQTVNLQRYFYHLHAPDMVPERWIHYENDPSDGSPSPIEFEFYWVFLAGEVPYLAGDQDAFLHLVG
jgi:8-oxo-dGTP pyrophosphatase MutT (NUDIX family)